MKGPTWSDAEKRMILDLTQRGLTETQIAMAINLNLGGHRTGKAVAAQKSRMMDRGCASVPHARAGKRNCLSCQKPFYSPDKRQIHICDTCKGSEIYRGAA